MSVASRFACVLTLAVNYGWELLAGTIDPAHNDPKWNGSYFSNDHQLVPHEDARPLARDLERALPAHPEHDASAHAETVIGPRPTGSPLRGSAPDTPVSAYKAFSGPVKDELKAAAIV